MTNWNTDIGCISSDKIRSNTNILSAWLRCAPFVFYYICCISQVLNFCDINLFSHLKQKISTFLGNPGSLLYTFIGSSQCISLLRIFSGIQTFDSFHLTPEEIK